MNIKEKLFVGLRLIDGGRWDCQRFRPLCDHGAADNRECRDATVVLRARSGRKAEYVHR
jgi:hypothetical protein